MNPAGMTTNHPQHSTDRQETTTDNACTLESAALIAYDERPGGITSLLNLLQKNEEAPSNSKTSTATVMSSLLPQTSGSKTYAAKED